MVVMYNMARKPYTWFGRCCNASLYGIDGS